MFVYLRFQTEHAYAILDQETGEVEVIWGNQFLLVLHPGYPGLSYTKVLTRKGLVGWISNESIT